MTEEKGFFEGVGSNVDGAVGTVVDGITSIPGAVAGAADRAGGAVVGATGKALSPLNELDRLVQHAGTFASGVAENIYAVGTGEGLDEASKSVAERHADIDTAHDAWNEAADRYMTEGFSQVFDSEAFDSASVMQDVVPKGGTLGDVVSNTASMVDEWAQQNGVDAASKGAAGPQL